MESGDNIETGRNDGGAKGLDGLSQKAAEIPEGYLSCEGFATEYSGI